MKGKIILSVFLAVALLVSTLAVTVLAANKPVKGDVNDDDTVDQLDYFQVKKIILSNPSEVPPALLAKADINGDGEVDALDYFSLKGFILDGPTGAFRIGLIKTATQKSPIAATYEGTLSGISGKANIAFKVVGDKLMLCGDISSSSANISIEIDMSKFSNTYTFVTHATYAGQSLTITGDLDAANYIHYEPMDPDAPTAFEQSIKNLTIEPSDLLSESDIDLYGEYCKEAIDCFLLKAFDLLEEANLAFDVGAVQFGFDNFYDEMDDFRDEVDELLSQVE